MKIMKFSWDQRKAIADFLTTVAAAWFSAGVITPFFNKTASATDVVAFLFIGLVMSSTALLVTMMILERKKL